MLKHNCSYPKSKLPCSHILQKLLKRFTQQELAGIYEYNEKTVRRRLKFSSLTKQKRGCKQKLEGDDLDSFRDYVIKTKDTTQKSLAKKFGCSQATICRSIERARVSYKEFTYQASEQLKKENKLRIKHFIDVILPELLESNANIFFLDECSFHLNEARRRGYEVIGERLFDQRPANKGKNQTLIFLAQITNGKKIIHSKLIEGGLNSEKFHQFLTEFNPPNNGKKNVLVMDNLPVHRAKKSCWKLGLSAIRELLRSKGVEVIFLPSYTPELNPVERIFNIIRKYVESKQARKRDRLDSVIKEKIKFFHQENLFKYLESSIRECLDKLAAIGGVDIDFIQFREQINYDGVYITKLANQSSLDYSFLK
jgi:transposase